MFSARAARIFLWGGHAIFSPFAQKADRVCRRPTASLRQSAVGTAPAPQGHPGPCCPAWGGGVRTGPGAPSPSRPRGGRGLAQDLLGKRAGVCPPGERLEDALSHFPLRSSGQRWALRGPLQQSWSDTPRPTPKGWRRARPSVWTGLRHLREWECSRPGVRP